eukprot:gene3021-13044_t
MRNWQYFVGIQYQCRKKDSPAGSLADSAEYPGAGIGCVPRKRGGFALDIMVLLRANVPLCVPNATKNSRLSSVHVVAHAVVGRSRVMSAPLMTASQKGPMVGVSSSSALSVSAARPLGLSGAACPSVTANAGPTIHTNPTIYTIHTIHTNHTNTPTMQASVSSSSAFAVSAARPLGLSASVSSSSAFAVSAARPLGLSARAARPTVTANAGPRTMFDKIWDDHLVDDSSEGSIIYIDRHLVHEVTSPQAFEGLRDAKRPVRRPDCTLVTVDHNVPTSDRSAFESVETFIKEADSRTQVLALEENAKFFNLTYYAMDDKRQGIVHIIGPEQGIVHIIGPEQGFTLPGTTCVCGDSHTATHGAFGALAFGIGTSEVEHVLATQTLVSQKGKNMRVNVTGTLQAGVTSKDVVLAVIGAIGTAGGTGHVLEFTGEAISTMSMEARMSICNMAIEGGARAGMIAPDQITFDYLKGRPMAPTGAAWDKAVEYWKTLSSDAGAFYDKEVTLDGSLIAPTCTWGTSPQDVVPITGVVPNPADAADPARTTSMQRSLDYMGLTPGTPLEGLKVDKVFIGSCTNGRIEDIRAAAEVAQGRKVASHVVAMVVPGSGLVKAQAEAEGLDKILIEAGFDWREPGCSMCLAMNPDKLEPQERCASTSNRNFEGRQGSGGRTHLVSPAMAAAAAVQGCLTDIRNLSVPPLPPANESIFAELIASMEAWRPAPTVNLGCASSSAANAYAGAAASDPTMSSTASLARPPMNLGCASSSAANFSGNFAASDPTKVYDRLSGTAAK